MDFEARRRRAKELDAQGALLESRMADLDKEQERLRFAYRENRRERAANAPFHALPDDILRLILETAYDHRHRDGNCFGIQTHIITHVSRRLRQLALSMPRLWDCIHLGPPTPLLQLQLSRTDNLPLRILFYHHEPVQNVDGLSIARDNYTATRYAEQLGLLLRQHAHRIAHLTIESHSIRLFLSVLPQLSLLPLPQAELLELSPCPPTLTLGVGRPYLLPKCPKLKELWISRMSVTFAHAVFNSLTFLSITHVDVPLSDLGDVAKACPSLTSLQLYPTGAAGNGSEIIKFPYLTTLRLSCESRPDTYLDWLDMPVLSVLTIVSVDLSSIDTDIRDPRSVRPFTTVRTLEFWGMKAADAPPYDANLLWYTPNAVTLKLSNCVAKARSLYEHLATADSLPLPALQMLTVTDLAKDAHEDLLLIVQHRVRHELPLKELELDEKMVGEMDAALLKALEEHVEVIELCDS